MALYADALVSIFRFLPFEDSAPLLQACIESERSDPVKTCAIRAFLTLVQDKSRFQWQRSFDDLVSAVASRCRDIMKVRKTYVYLIVALTSNRVLVFDALISTRTTNPNEWQHGQSRRGSTQNLFQIGKFLCLGYSRFGEKCQCSSRKDYRRRKRLRDGFWPLSKYGRRQSISPSKSRRPTACRRSQR